MDEKKLDDLYEYSDGFESALRTMTILVVITAYIWNFMQ